MNETMKEVKRLSYFDVLPDGFKTWTDFFVYMNEGGHLTDDECIEQDSVLTYTKKAHEKDKDGKMVLVEVKEWVVVTSQLKNNVLKELMDKKDKKKKQ